MLVLTRKILETVVVGGSGVIEPLIKVTVLEIRNGKVRLGFEADGSLPVHRGEIWERIRAGNQGDSPPAEPAQPVV